MGVGAFQPLQEANPSVTVFGRETPVFPTFAQGPDPTRPDQTQFPADIFEGVVGTTGLPGGIVHAALMGLFSGGGSPPPAPPSPPEGRGPSIPLSTIAQHQLLARQRERRAALGS